MNFNYNNLEKASIRKFFEIEKYTYLINNKAMIDSKEYQAAFIKYCDMRYQDKEWLDKYFRFFSKNINNTNIEFREILEYLYEETNRIETSFSSKMLAIINPEKPIWDSNVSSVLDLCVEGNTPKERKEDAIKKYDELLARETDLLKKDDVKEYISCFRKMFPEYDYITDIRVLDFYLWRYKIIDEDT